MLSHFLNLYTTLNEHEIFKTNVSDLKIYNLDFHNIKLLLVLLQPVTVISS